MEVVVGLACLAHRASYTGSTCTRFVCTANVNSCDQGFTEAKLLLQALAANPDIRVTFVGVTRRYQQCQEGVQAQSNAASAIQYRCLAPEHFVPAVRSPSGVWLPVIITKIASSADRHISRVEPAPCHGMTEDLLKSLDARWCYQTCSFLVLPSVCHDRGRSCLLYTPTCSARIHVDRSRTFSCCDMQKAAPRIFRISRQ